MTNRILPVLIAVLASLACGLHRPAMAGPQIVFDMRSGAVIAATNPHDLWYPASLTKLMTTYVALDAVRAGEVTLQTLLIASDRAAAEPPSKIGIPAGRSITLQNALQLLITKSANDIATVVAEGISGSVEDFTARMTQTARQLGMTRSQFVNAHGLPAEGQVTTAHDMAVLARALDREFPEIAQMYRVPYVMVGDRRIRSYNLLLGRYSGADGMKTGFICASGFNIVATATRDGRRIGTVVMGATSSLGRHGTAERLLDLGFSVPDPAYAVLPKLYSLGRGADGSDAPGNMRDVVCGPNRPQVKRELQPIVETEPRPKVLFGLAGLDPAAMPLPTPRPLDLFPVNTAAAETAIGAGAPSDTPLLNASATAKPTVPLPIPRPAQ